MSTAAGVRTGRCGGRGTLFNRCSLQAQEAQVSWLRGPGRRRLRCAGTDRPTSTTVDKTSVHG